MLSIVNRWIKLMLHIDLNVVDVELDVSQCDAYAYMVIDGTD